LRTDRRRCDCAAEVPPLEFVALCLGVGVTVEQVASAELDMCKKLNWALFSVMRTMAPDVKRMKPTT